MQSQATTVTQYLAELPAGRRFVIERVRAVILQNLDPVFEEGIQYGLIGYYVPHRVYPGGCADRRRGHQLRARHFPAKGASAGCLRRLGQSLCVLSHKFDHRGSVPGSTRRLRDQQGRDSFTPDQPLPVTLVKELDKTRIAENGGYFAQ